MDFKLARVKQDIIQAKKIVLENDDYHTQMDYLGKGGAGIVHGFGSAAVKYEKSSKSVVDVDARRQQIIKWLEDYIRLSQKGVQEGLHFAPFFDSLLKESSHEFHKFSFMPRIEGDTIKHANGLKRLVSIGVDGLKTYFHDYTALQEIGFGIPENDEVSDNFVVSDKHINMLDLFIRGDAPLSDQERQIINLFAAANILNDFHNSIVYQKGILRLVNPERHASQLEMFAELIGNTESALSTVKHSSRALSKVKEMRKSDFSQNMNIY